MNRWPKHPVIYEINTWVWLQELSQEYKSPVTLAKVPREKWDAIADLKVDAVWFMGVWERSPAGIRIAMQNQGLLSDFRRALPDFSERDNVGSPYCVRRYVVDEHLGGPEGLAIARRELAQRGLKLIFDFVPNHVAPDHPWVISHPEYFVQGNADDARNDPASFVKVGGKVFACGRDPYFPAWPDVLQLNAFQRGLRQVVIETFSDIANQCDGVRCDMAMLMMNSIFERTWGIRAGQRPLTEYWVDVISAVKKAHPDFLFMAEAYWDLEWELQQQGFDFCYDKKLYDRLEHDNAESIRLHLCADLAYQNKVVRFIENHDEPRAAAAFPPEKEQAVAVTIATIPGARLFHEGQFEGRKVRLPVFLGRRPEEPVNSDLRAFYYKLLRMIQTLAFREGEWRLCDRTGWPDNQSHLNLVAWCWKKDAERYCIVVNLSGQRSQARIRLPWGELTGKSWRLTDAFTEEAFERVGGEMVDPGFYVDLHAWGYHFFQFNRG
jgi:Alpha amylase, catalytic domain